MLCSNRILYIRAMDRKTPVFGEHSFVYRKLID
jgi:hypothetical protein